MQKEFIEIVKQFILTMSKFLEKLEVRTADDFKEADHPRDKDGKFAKTSGASGTKGNKGNAEKSQTQKTKVKTLKQADFPENNIKQTAHEELNEQQQAAKQRIYNRIEDWGITDEVLEPAVMDKIPTTQEIISKISGGDETDGSCSSAALTYIANKLGYDCRDFKGGEVTDFFARDNNIQAITKMYNGTIIEGFRRNETSTCMDIFKQMEVGKEYYFFTGYHAAIVYKKSERETYYLEMQNPEAEENTFKLLKKQQLKERFECEVVLVGKSKSGYVPLENFAKYGNFKDLAKYFNTAEDKQQKGADGYEK